MIIEEYKKQIYDIMRFKKKKYGIWLKNKIYIHNEETYKDREFVEKDRLFSKCAILRPRFKS